MNYGYFDDPNREYVITNPRTPTKWINYIGTLQFGGFVDHTGGALICKNDPTFNRITKYIQQMPSSEFKGETLYLRVPLSQNGRGDRGEGGYKVFSPFFVPTLDNYDKYECRVGLNYTRIVSEFYGIRTEVTIFVPINAAVEVRDIRITNIGGKPLEVDAIPVMVNPAGADGLLRGGGGFFAKQLITIIVSSVYAFLFTYVMLWAINKVTRVRTTEGEEERGLDDSLHGETAYAGV